MTLYPGDACLDGVNLHGLVSMGLLILPWIHFSFIFIPPRFYFFLSCMSHVSCPMLNWDCNGGCQGLVRFC